MPRFKIRKGRRGRRNPEGALITSSSGGSIVYQIGAGVGGYAASRIGGRIGASLGAKRSPGWRRGAKVIVAAAAVAAAYYLPQKYPEARKYRKALLAGAIVAFVQALLEEFAPRVAGLIGLKVPALQQAQQQAQIAAQQQAYVAANRVTLPHPDDDVYDQMEAAQEARYNPPPQPPAQAYAQQAQAAAQAPQGGHDEFEDDGEDYGAGGIFLD